MLVPANKPTISPGPVFGNEVGCVTVAEAVVTVVVGVVGVEGAVGVLGVVGVVGVVFGVAFTALAQPIMAANLNVPLGM